MQLPASGRKARAWRFRSRGAYFAATKQKVPDKGIQIVSGRAHGEGPFFSARFRVAPLRRACMALSEMVARAYEFDSEGGIDASRIITKATWRVVPIQRKLKV